MGKIWPKRLVDGSCASTFYAAGCLLIVNLVWSVQKICRGRNTSRKEQAWKQLYGASLLVLRLAELTLLDAVASEQVIVEAERNLVQKLPAVLPTFKLLVVRCLKIVRDPAIEELQPYLGCAQPEDLPILVAAAQAHCHWLVTFNVRHYQPGVDGVRVLRPGDFVLRMRELLTHLT